jgi:hypothetical protein
MCTSYESNNRREPFDVFSLLDVRRFERSFGLGQIPPSARLSSLSAHGTFELLVVG